MSIDGNGSPGRDDNAPAAASDGGDKSAEQAGRQQGGENDPGSQQPAEPRTREQYADATRAAGPPIRRDSSESHTADRDSAGPHDQGKPAEHLAVLPHEREHNGPALAEPLTREEYAGAVRGNGDVNMSPGPLAQTGADNGSAEETTSAAVTHFHSEFKDQPLDIYTDGARWASVDTPNRQETVSEKGDTPGRLPTGQELVDSAGEGSSLLDRLRRGVYEESNDELDVLEKDTNLVHDVFSHPPTSSYESSPTPEPHIYETQHSGIDPGSAVTAVFTLGVVIDRAAHWVMGHYRDQVKGR